MEQMPYDTSDTAGTSCIGSGRNMVDHERDEVLLSTQDMRLVAAAGLEQSRLRKKRKRARFVSATTVGEHLHIGIFCR